MTKLNDVYVVLEIEDDEIIHVDTVFSTYEKAEKYIYEHMEQRGIDADVYEDYFETDYRIENLNVDVD